MPKKYHIKLNEKDVLIVENLLNVARGSKSKKALAEAKRFTKPEVHNVWVLFNEVKRSIGKDNRRERRKKARENAKLGREAKKNLIKQAKSLDVKSLQWEYDPFNGNTYLRDANGNQLTMNTTWHGGLSSYTDGTTPVLSQNIGQALADYEKGIESLMKKSKKGDKK